ncbi:MAG: SDR family NAD(P)-dependent oxidoreductase [Myxococcota bacterium]|nr:SDR family NAD(P)-dependent oxidoreductase [Myxococcota bacterium]
MVILVTGCRSGFGLLAAVEAARRGHRVYAGLRDLGTAGPLREAAGELPVFPVQLDVTSAEQRQQVVQRILEEEGRLDALVNNAGIALGGYLEQIDEDELRRVLEVNVMAVWSLTNLVLPAMREQGSGTIVNVSSISGRLALPGLGAYACSKFALEGMSEALRHELRPFGVRVCLIEPGPYKTDILGRNRALCRRAYEDGPYTPYTEKAEQLFDRIATTAGDPLDVAREIVALCESKRPPLRTVMGPSARLRVLLKRYGPWGLLEGVIGRATSP